jgi:cellulose synthase/poly-beta-1,6-N-acetylglucosamine synthase-like glycosyltransferase
MEFFVMGFAVLLAKDNGEPSSVIAGLILALLFLITPGILKKKSGWIFGSLLQIPMIAYAVVVPSMAIVGPIFAGLWVAAIVIGRKGEAIRAKLLAESDGAQES